MPLRRLTQTDGFISLNTHIRIASEAAIRIRMHLMAVTITHAVHFPRPASCSVLRTGWWLRSCANHGHGANESGAEMLIDGDE